MLNVFPEIKKIIIFKPSFGMTYPLHCNSIQNHFLIAIS